MKIYVILIVVFLLSCRKDEPRFDYKESDEVLRYVITLENSRIKELKLYTNNSLSLISQYITYDSILKIITTDSQDNLKGSKTFYISSNGMAAICIDSINYLSGYFVQEYKYTYDNGFLISANVFYKDYSGVLVDSGYYNNKYTIGNENTTSFLHRYCTDHYKYNDVRNKIDIKTFANGITGKINANLIEHASWSNGCPNGPSSSIAYSDFQYSLNSDGYVTSMFEIYTPSYHLGDTKIVTREVRKTFYEYVNK